MEYYIGVSIGLAVAIFAKLVGFDRGRSFYPTVLIVVAFYYPLFATLGASETVLEIEVAIALGFSLLAALGFKRSMWLVAASIAGHGAFDLLRPSWIENPGVPLWWPGFCASADLILGAWLAAFLWKETAAIRPAYGRASIANTAPSRSRTVPDASV